MPIQIPTIVLPRVWTLGTELEPINDLVVHTSIDILLRDLLDKSVHVYAFESLVGVGGVPGPLWCWIEVSPVPSSVSTVYWTAIGGGGGAVAPVAPVIEAGLGVHLSQHGILLNWTRHDPWARVRVQCPVNAAIATAIWVVQVLFEGSK